MPPVPSPPERRVIQEPRRRVLVTGASAGLGAALARVYAANQWDLILTGRRVDLLVALSRELAQLGADAVVLPADLADPAAPVQLFGAASAQGLKVDGLVNNAGFSRTAPFLEGDPSDHAAMIRVMLTSPVELSRLFAPGMKERSFGRILNVASLAGQLPATGGDTLYGPIKSFLIKASLGLHLEMKGTGVHVTALCPGYTLTEFHDVNGTRGEVMAAYPDWMWQTAEHVAKVGYRASEANRPKVVPGVMNGLLAGLAKHLPDTMALSMVARHANRLKRL
jgi:short-subunit dehydrogenase